jgi:hypothetical protein
MSEQHLFRCLAQAAEAADAQAPLPVAVGPERARQLLAKAQVADRTAQHALRALEDASKADPTERGSTLSAFLAKIAADGFRVAILQYQALLAEFKS